GLAVLAFDQAEVHLIERDDLEAAGAYLADGRLEKLRGDLEDAIGLESARLLRAHVVQHEDCTNASGQGRDDVVCTRVVHCGENGSQQACCAPCHCGLLPSMSGSP